MLELYGDMIDTREPQNEPQPDQETTQTHPKSNLKTENEPKSEPQKVANESQDGPQKLLEAVKMNPKITKAALSDLLGVSISTLKRWLKANEIVWVGHSKNGHWQLRKFY